MLFLSVLGSVWLGTNMAQKHVLANRYPKEKSPEEVRKVCA